MCAQDIAEFGRGRGADVLKELMVFGASRKGGSVWHGRLSHAIHSESECLDFLVPGFWSSKSTLAEFLV